MEHQLLFSSAVWLRSGGLQTDRLLPEQPAAGIDPTCCLYQSVGTMGPRPLVLTTRVSVAPFTLGRRHCLSERVWLLPHHRDRGKDRSLLFNLKYCEHPIHWS